jgi:XTP/dITP diphosphohydrolase
MKEQKLLIATKNPGKWREILEVVGDLEIEYVFLGDLEVEDSDFVEDGETFKENAFKKAKYYFDKTGMLSLGEDSGILIDAFPGELGVKTRRWGAGEKASDQEWIDYFMKRMRGVEDRRGRFVCCGCLYDGKEAQYFKGETCGVITEEMRAEIIPGIPISSCFIPEGLEKVYSNLSVEEKNQVSHRGKAMVELREVLEGA